MKKKIPQNEQEFQALKPQEQMKYEIAKELGLYEKVLDFLLDNAKITGEPTTE